MFQVSSGGVVINKDKDVLLLKKKNGMYCLPKGHVEAGEALGETAIREVKEETNIDCELLDYVGKLSYSFRFAKTGRVDKIVHWYLMKPISFDLMPQRSEGFVLCSFFDYLQSQRLLSHRNERRIVRQAYEKLKKYKDDEDF